MNPESSSGKIRNPPVAPPPCRPPPSEIKKVVQRGASSPADTDSIYDGRNSFLGRVPGILSQPASTLSPISPEFFRSPTTVFSAPMDSPSSSFHQSSEYGHSDTPESVRQQHTLEFPPNLWDYVPHDISYLGPIVDHEPPGYDPLTMAYENIPFFDPHIQDIITAGYDPFGPIVVEYNGPHTMPYDDMPPIGDQTLRAGSGRLPEISHTTNVVGDLPGPPNTTSYSFMPTPRSPAAALARARARSSPRMQFPKPTPFPRIHRGPR